MLSRFKKFKRFKSAAIAVLFLGCLFSFVPAGLAQDAAISQNASPASALQWLPLFMSLFGGLALFLYGMDKMATGLKSAVGEKMKVILGRFTSNRIKAAISGSVVTAIIQSSSVTTVLVVGFVSAGLMTLSQSVGIIMGANVGTTITAQIVAFKVEKAALALIAVGFVLLFQGKNDLRRQLGNMLMGLGLVFFGMTIMSDGVNPLRSYQPFLDLMVTMKNPLLGILVGALFTALVQSSSATTGIVIAMASQGFIELPAGIALVLGANIGTCATALLATIGKTRDAVRVALVHVLFNVLGVLLWVGFIPHLADWVRTLSPSETALQGTARLAADVPRQIANAHTIFNIANTVLLLPFSGLLARLARRWIKDKPLKEKSGESMGKYLNDFALEVPSMALQNVRMEAAELASRVQKMMNQVPQILRSSDETRFDDIEQADDAVDTLHRAILRYAGKISKLALNDAQSREFRKLMIAVDALERVGDVISNDIVKICRKRIHKQISSTDKLVSMQMELQKLLNQLLYKCERAIRESLIEEAHKILETRGEVDRRIEAFFAHQESRFQEVDADRIAVFRIEMDLVEKQRRIFGLLERIALQLTGLSLEGPGLDLGAKRSPHA